MAVARVAVVVEVMVAVGVAVVAGVVIVAGVAVVGGVVVVAGVVVVFVFVAGVVAVVIVVRGPEGCGVVPVGSSVMVVGSPPLPPFGRGGSLAQAASGGLVDERDEWLVEVTVVGGVVLGAG